MRFQRHLRGAQKTEEEKLKPREKEQQDVGVENCGDYRAALRGFEPLSMKYIGGYRSTDTLISHTQMCVPQPCASCAARARHSGKS